MGLRKDRAQVKRNYVAFYTNDPVLNWIEEKRGYEKRSHFIHRTLEQVRKKENETED